MLTKSLKPQLAAMFMLLAVSMIGFSFLLALLTHDVVNTLHFSQSAAYSVYAAFIALSFTTPLLGAYLAERSLGFYHAVHLSIALTIIGFLLLCVKGVVALYLGLSFIVMSTGLMVPGLYILLGYLYSDNDPRRRTGFTLVYLGMNVGTLVAFFLSGFLAKYISYSTAYYLSAVVTLLMFPLLIGFRRLLILIDHAKQKLQTNIANLNISLPISYTIIIATLMALYFLFSYPSACNILLLTLGFFSAVFIIYLSLIKKGNERTKLLVFLALLIISIAFWASYYLLGSALNQFVGLNVNRHIFNFTIPTETVLTLNPIFLLVLSPIMAYAWLKLKGNNQGLFLITVFSIGLILMGVAYLLLVLGIADHSSDGKISLGWIVLSYALQSLAELFIAPIGFSMVGQLIPQAHEGKMMGILQLSTGVAGVISGYIAKTTISTKGFIAPLKTDLLYSHTFLMLGLTTVLIGIVSILIGRYALTKSLLL